jgi:hypothetical protein
MVNRRMITHPWTLWCLLVLVAMAEPARAQLNWQPVSRLEPGTVVAVRTTESIDTSVADGRVYSGIVDQDVVDSSGRLAIPRGATVELVVRNGADSERILDLDSVFVNGQRYALDAGSAAVGTSGAGLGVNQRTGEYVGGGAVLGAIIGAIAGGAKGAAIGAATGAAAGAGAEVLTHGRTINVPAESLLTFSLRRPLEIGVADTGYTREGVHYHRF